MAPSQKVSTYFQITLFFCLLFCSCGWSSISDGQILLLIKEGKDEKAFSLYKEKVALEGHDDYELLHQMALGMIDFGFRQSDPEIQLLSLFGASISAHEEVYYILEKSLHNRYPQIQIVGLNALANLRNDRADQAILKAMGSDQAVVRLEAAQHLCQKKHPQAVNQTESFMCKLPASTLSVFPPMLAQAGTPQAMILLRKLIHHPANEVRVAVILSAAQTGRDDLIPQIRQQMNHSHFSQQEACAFALGLFQDEASRSKLIQLTHSPYSSVALAAHVALYKIGQEDAPDAIESMAAQDDLFAISALGDIPDRSKILIQDLTHPNLQIRVNAVIALLKQKNPKVLPYLKEILIQDKRDLAFTKIHSPGSAFTALKVTPSAGKIFKDDLPAYIENIEIKEEVLKGAREFSQKDFILLANEIFSTQQNELIPLLTDLLEEMETPEALQCLKLYQQKLGAPLVRNYCTLALYRMQEPGPYGDQLRKWVKTQNQSDIIRFAPFTPWEIGKQPYQLSPEQTSQLFIKACEAIAENQDPEGVATLIEAITTGHQKNKYVLAGLLLRATQ